MTQNNPISAALDEILLWHDEPQIISLVDGLSNKYLMVAIPSDDNQSHFYGVNVSENDFYQIIKGATSLRQIFDTNIETGVTAILHNTDEILLWPNSAPDADWLPDDNDAGSFQALGLTSKHILN